MGPVQIGGLPAHALLVHVTVVLVPLAALMLLAGTLWPAAQRRLGVGTPVVALVALVSVPLATHAGEWLRDQLGPAPLIARHAELGDQLLPWAAGLFVLAAVQWVLARRAGSSSARGARSQGAGAQGDTRVRTRLPVLVTAGLAVLSVVVALGAVWMVYRTGDSGAQAVWQGIV